jgi:hypothetical protein
MHGGAAGSGAPKGKSNGKYRHGGFTTEAIDERRRLASLVEGQAPQWAVDLEKRHGDHLSATDPVWQHATCDERHHTVTWHLSGENE